MGRGIRIRNHLPSRGRNPLGSSSQGQARVKVPNNSSRDPKSQARVLLCKGASKLLNKVHQSCRGMERLDSKTSLMGKRVLQEQEGTHKRVTRKKVKLRVQCSKGPPNLELNSRLHLRR